MTTFTPDILALCAAIDAGDDETLPILADALEETGDSLSVGIRRLDQPSFLLSNTFPVPSTEGTEFVWRRRVLEIDIPQSERHLGWHFRVVEGANSLPGAVFSSLQGGEYIGGDWDARFYSSRSAAYLALAKALSA